MKIPLPIMNSNATYGKSKNRELLTSYNRLGLYMSYKETKQHRNNLAKLAILNSEPYGISRPTHFSPTQFALAAMDNFDHCDANSLAGMSVAHDTAITSYDINGSISLPCQDITEFSTNKVKNILENFDASDELLSLENANDK